MKKKHKFKKSMTLPAVNTFLNLANLISRLMRKVSNAMILKKYLLEKFEAREDDIYIASFLRSGTTWVQMILHQLTSDGEVNFKHIYEISPFFELALGRNLSLEHLPSPRLIKTHSAQKNIPRRTKGKFIYLIRDGKDAAVSLFHFYEPMMKDLTFERSFEQHFLKEETKHGWFGHVSGWLANKKKLTILYVKYEDLLKDLEGNIRKISDFCGFTIDESQMPRILERCSFDFMKNHQEKFDGRLVNRPNSQAQLNDFIRKGKAKEGNKYFEEKQNRIYEKMFKKFLSRYEILNS